MDREYPAIKAQPSKERSRIMAAVGRRNTGPELQLRHALHACGLRFRLNSPRGLPGSPDIRFPTERVAVFVDGCFWHGCPAHGTQPKANSVFWLAKIKRNRERDGEVDQELVRLGWLSVRIWEHDIKQDVTEAALRVWVAVRSRGT